MEIDFKFKHMDTSDALKGHFEEKAERIQKLLPYNFTMHVFFSIEKTEKTCEITCNVEHRSLVATSRKKDMYEAIDDAVHKLETQIKKDRDRKKGQQSAHQVNRRGNERLASDIDAEIPHRLKKAVDQE